MIQNPFANMMPVVKNLLIINLICFLPSLLPNQRLAELEALYGGAHYFASPLFKLWQPITYMFLHGGFAHIFFNMFALVSFGSLIEQTLGSKRFFNFYFMCGLGGIALQMVVQAIEVHMASGGISVPGVNALNVAATDGSSPFLVYGMPAAQKLYDIYNGTMVGASGAIFGLLVAFGMLFPNLELMIMFIPVPVKAKYIVPGYIILELVLGFSQVAGDSVAHFAHLGGALIGFIVIKLWGYRSRDNFY